jgi:hypothetical protein
VNCECVIYAYTLFACARTRHVYISRCKCIHAHVCIHGTRLSETRSYKYNFGALCRAVRAYSWTIKNVGRYGPIFTALCLLSVRNSRAHFAGTTVFPRARAKISLLLMLKYLICRTWTAGRGSRRARLRSCLLQQVESHSS